MSAELNRPQASAVAEILTREAGTCSQINLETVTSSVLEGAITVEVVYASSRETRTFIVDQKGCDMELKKYEGAFAA